MDVMQCAQRSRGRAWTSPIISPIMESASPRGHFVRQMSAHAITHVMPGDSPILMSSTSISGHGVASQQPANSQQPTNSAPGNYVNISSRGCFSSRFSIQQPRYSQSPHTGFSPGSGSSFVPPHLASYGKEPLLGTQLAIAREDRPLKLVVFDFDCTLSAFHVFASLAGTPSSPRPILVVPPPHARTEQGQLRRLTELDFDPAWGPGTFALKAFGGAQRVAHLRGLLEELVAGGVECVIASRGMAGTVRRILEQLKVLDFFTHIFANMGCALGVSAYDSDVLGAVDTSREECPGICSSQFTQKADIISKRTKELNLECSQVAFVEDDLDEIKSVTSDCRKIHVAGGSGICDAEIQVLRLMLGGRAASPTRRSSIEVSPPASPSRRCSVEAPAVSSPTHRSPTRRWSVEVPGTTSPIRRCSIGAPSPLTPSPLSPCHGARTNLGKTIGVEGQIGVGKAVDAVAPFLMPVEPVPMGATASLTSAEPMPGAPRQRLSQRFHSLRGRSESENDVKPASPLLRKPMPAHGDSTQESSTFTSCDRKTMSANTEPMSESDFTPASTPLQRLRLTHAESKSETPVSTRRERRSESAHAESTLDTLIRSTRATGRKTEDTTTPIMWPDQAPRTARSLRSTQNGDGMHEARALDQAQLKDEARKACTEKDLLAATKLYFDVQKVEEESEELRKSVEDAWQKAAEEDKMLLEARKKLEDEKHTPTFPVAKMTAEKAALKAADSGRARTQAFEQHSSATVPSAPKQATKGSFVDSSRGHKVPQVKSLPSRSQREKKQGTHVSKEELWQWKDPKSSGPLPSWSSDSAQLKISQLASESMQPDSSKGQTGALQRSRKRFTRREDSAREDLTWASVRDLA